MKKYALIKAIHSYIPKKKLTNEQLASEYPGWQIEKIYNDRSQKVLFIFLFI